MSLHTSVGESGRLLSPLDPDPVTIINGDSTFPVLLVCEHAGQTVPRALGDLGLKADALNAHIGWDIGAAGVTRLLADRIGATAVMQSYSRLVIDCNRPPEAPDAMPEPQPPAEDHSVQQACLQAWSYHTWSYHTRRRPALLRSPTLSSS